MGQHICGWNQRSRLDRVFFTQNTIEPVNLCVIGQKSFRTEDGKDLWISDHFGLYGQVRICT